MNDKLTGSGLTIGEALLSPTRTYLPLIKDISTDLGTHLRGAVHCSGGGQTKCLRFGSQVKFIKDNLFSAPPLFQEIQKVSGTTEEEMYQVYNMGHRLEIYCEPRHEDNVLAIAKNYSIDAKVIGITAASETHDQKNHLEIINGKKVLKYQ